jgi:hypothetical protein
MFARLHATLWRSTHAEDCPARLTCDRAITHALGCPECQKGEGACPALWVFVMEAPACSCGYEDQNKGVPPGRVGCRPTERDRLAAAAVLARVDQRRPADESAMTRMDTQGGCC